MPEWFVLNVRDAEWWVNPKFGARTFLAGDAPQVGVRIHVLEAGKPSTLYHRESGQEGFLVVEGACLLIVEGEERLLRRWDYFHCAPNTTHSFVGVGNTPCVMVTVGARDEDGSILYPRDDTALAHGAGVEQETPRPGEAYAPFPKWEPRRPSAWGVLPWGNRLDEEAVGLSAPPL